jgi:hypothetical protein
MSFIVAVTSILITLSLLFFWMIAKMIFPKPVGIASPEMLAEFSTRRYEPMMRLLRRADFEYLLQNGVDRKFVRELQSSRRRAFRGYLRMLTLDFNRLHTTAKMLLLSAPSDRPEFAKALVYARLTFSLGLLEAHTRLALSSAGFPVEADLRQLVGQMETMRGNLQGLAMAASPAV